MTAKQKRSILFTTGTILILSASFIVIGMISLLTRGFFPNIVQLLLNLLTIITSVVGAFYVFNGATKATGAKLLKVFFLLNIIKIIVVLFDIGNRGTTSFIELIGCVIPFAGYSIFLISLDLGKTKSFAIAITMTIVFLINITFNILSNNLPFIAILSQLATLVSSISIFVFIWAKYKDKEERKTV